MISSTTEVPVPFFQGKDPFADDPMLLFQGEDLFKDDSVPTRKTEGENVIQDVTKVVSNIGETVTALEKRNHNTLSGKERLACMRAVQHKANTVLQELESLTNNVSIEGFGPALSYHVIKELNTMVNRCQENQNSSSQKKQTTAKQLADTRESISTLTSPSLPSFIQGTGFNPSLWTDCYESTPTPPKNKSTQKQSSGVAPSIVDRWKSDLPEENKSQFYSDF